VIWGEKRRERGVKGEGKSGIGREEGVRVGKEEGRNTEA
jgi:hypothetical protein